MNTHVRLPGIARFALVVLALISVSSAQGIYDTASAPFVKAKELSAIKLAEPALPSSKALTILSLGNTSALADLLWIDTIQYFGAGNPYQNYPSLGKLATTITDLDPKFEKPYEFSLVTLPFMGQSDTAVTLGLKAQTTIPNNGLLTYYLATVYHLNFKDYANAAKYYKLASTEPGAPGAAALLAATSLDQISNSLNDRLIAASFWQTVYENATNEDEKARAKSWYEQMQIVYSIELSASQYKTKYGSYPVSLDALVQTGYLSSVPVSPVNRKLSLDPQTGKVDFSQLAS